MLQLKEMKLRKPEVRSNVDKNSDLTEKEFIQIGKSWAEKISEQQNLIHQTCSSTNPFLPSNLKIRK